MNQLVKLGFEDYDSVCDVGAGDMHFGRFLADECGYRGLYTPVDGSIDATNLETWVPEGYGNWFVAIEVLEHLHNWERMIMTMKGFATHGFVLTVPNPDVVDVLACDPTHVSVITAVALIDLGIQVRTEQFFDQPHDTIVGWY